MKSIKKYGPWALITGASYGIGSEFAMQLAAAGLNLVLVARSENKLAALSNLVTERFHIKTRIVSLDLSSPHFLDELIARTQGLDIGLVVSNAGAYNYGSFLKRNLKELSSFLFLNTQTHMQLCYHFGNLMRENHKGGILLVSSMGAFTSIPYMANYAAAKSYVLSLGQSLHLELKESGVDIMVLLPGTVETPGTMTKANVDNKKLGVAFMSPKVVVSQALKHFGSRSMYIPGGMNKFSFILGKYVLSRLTMSKIIGGIMRKAVSRDSL